MVRYYSTYSTIQLLNKIYIDIIQYLLHTVNYWSEIKEIRLLTRN